MLLGGIFFEQEQPQRAIRKDCRGSAISPLRAQIVIGARSGQQSGAGRRAAQQKPVRFQFGASVFYAVQPSLFDVISRHLCF